MKKFIFSFAVVAAMFASCSQDADLEIVDNGAKAEAITSVNASSESGTRAVVDGTSIKWQTGDKLGVLGTNTSSEAKNTAYTLSSGEGTTTGSFTNNDSEINTISATMYPYQEGAAWDATNSKLTLEIPSVQTGVKGSFDPKAAIMYAFGSSTDQALKLAVNFLKVTIGAGETNVHSITISSTTTVLSGKMEVTSSSVTAAPEGTFKSVTLTAGANKCFEAGDYYIAVKAGDIVSPYVSYVYYNNDHTATEKTKAGTTTLAFDGKNVRGISANFSSGTVTTRTAVQLWANGPYFAEENVSVNSSNFVPWQAGMDAWGTSWTIPSEAQMRDLFNESTFNWAQNPNGTDYGFKFTGKALGYASVSLFLPSVSGIARTGSARYWSGTTDGETQARYVLLVFNANGGNSNLNSSWSSLDRTNDYFVRLVLR